MLSSLEEIKDLRAPLRLSQMMSNAGYTDLQSRMIPLPLCDWSTGNIFIHLKLLHQHPFRYDAPKLSDVGIESEPAWADS